MRLLRLIFVALLAIVLITVALANRQIVTLNAFPANFGQYLGGQWSVDLPLFLVILLAALAGMVAGLIWEWLREAHLRRESSLRAERLARLEQQGAAGRPVHHRPQDEILAIVDAPARMPATARTVPADPATGTTLPSAARR